MDNQKKLFQNIKLVVIEWVEKNQNYFKENNVEMTILRNEEDGFVVSFENTLCMAEIVVEEPSFAPYRFISFEIAAIEDNRAKIIYSWYDDTTSEDDIEKNLKKGIDYFIGKV